eukprot:gene10787-12582_t
MARHEADSQQNKKPRLGEATKDGTFIQLTKAQIPEYLKSSEFFASLSSDDDIPFPVPSCCFKSNTTIASEEDLRNLLSTVRFWGVKEIVPSMVEYCRKNQLKEELASEFGNELQYVRVFPSFYKTPPKGVMRQALLSGQLNLVCHLLENGYCFSPFSVSHAIEGGNLECFEYVCHHARTALMDRIDSHLLDCAKYGRLDFLKFLHKVSEQPVTLESGRAAIRSNHADCLQYIANNSPYQRFSYEWTMLAAELGLTIVQALKYKQLSCLQYAVSHGCYKSGHDSLCKMAAEAGALECLQYLCKQGYLCDYSALEEAIVAGHEDCVEFLRKKGVK